MNPGPGQGGFMESPMVADSGNRRVIIEGIRHDYKGGTRALDGVDLKIDGGLFGLLGPNGAGKSTLMRILCTLLVPSEGKASVGGFDVVSRRGEVRKLIGYLPQEFSAWRVQRVHEVLETMLSLSGGGDRSRRRARAEEILEAVGLGDVANRKVKKLSGGMRRRLGIAQALVHEPPFLIVDEPTVGLDPEERLRFRALMADLAKDRTIIFSTHIVADLGSGCQDLALIHEGRLVFRGSPVDLINRARGHVVEIAVSGQEEAGLAGMIEVVSRTTEEGWVRIRGVLLGDQNLDGAKMVEEPSLEEAYLAFMLKNASPEQSREVF